MSSGVFKLIFTGAQLLYTVVLVFAVQQNESASYGYTYYPLWFAFLSH